MFEKELFTYLKENFTTQYFKIVFGFGEIEEKTKAPYIVLFPLNNDGTRQVLCDSDNYTDGDVSIQFSIYAADYSNALYIGRQLDEFLAELKLLPNYRILLNQHETNRGFSSINNALSLETISRRFTYTQLAN